MSNELIPTLPPDAEIQSVLEDYLFDGHYFETSPFLDEDAAWHVVAAMQADGWEFSLGSDNSGHADVEPWNACFSKRLYCGHCKGVKLVSGHAGAPSMARAITTAAYNATEAGNLRRSPDLPL